METVKQDWVFAALYVSSGNIPGAKLFHTEKDFDDMPREIHEAGYGGWASGGPWGCMHVETFEQAKFRLNKLLQAKNDEEFENISTEICFDYRDFIVSDPTKLNNCYVWWTNDNNGSTPFVSCLKNEDEFCKLDGWFCDMMDKYDDDIKDRICRGDMEGSTSRVYTASQIEEDACIQEELMS